MKSRPGRDTFDSPKDSAGVPESPAHAFGQFRGALHRYLSRRLKSAQNAEDLAQEVYLRLLRATDPRKVKFPQAYLYRIACNVLYEFQVRERGGGVSFDSDMVDQLAEHVTDAAALPEEAYEEMLKESRLKTVIAELPPMQRAVLKLATQHSLSHAQIAEELGISVSTMRNHLYKAIDYCRHRLADD